MAYIPRPSSAYLDLVSSVQEEIEPMAYKGNAAVAAFKERMQKQDSSEMGHRVPQMPQFTVSEQISRERYLLGEYVALVKKLISQRLAKGEDKVSISWLRSEWDGILTAAEVDKILQACRVNGIAIDDEYIYTA